MIIQRAVRFSTEIWRFYSHKATSVVSAGKIRQLFFKTYYSICICKNQGDEKRFAAFTLVW